MIQFAYPEGATPLDLDESEALLLTHISTRAELDRWEQENIVEAIEWLDRTKPNKILNEQFTKKLHQMMFRHVWRWAGHFRQSDKNIGEPWFQISTSLRMLCDNTFYQIEKQIETPDELAIRFHHRLVWIHAFPNGNGRHARLMTDILLKNVLGCPKFTWGGENLRKSSNTRNIYFDALRFADRGNYDLLRQFVRT